MRGGVGFVQTGHLDGRHATELLQNVVAGHLSAYEAPAPQSVMVNRSKSWVTTGC